MPFGSFTPLTLVLWAMAIAHFIKRRPDTYWLWIIIIGGPIGALVYLVVEALPDLRLNHSFQWVHRRKRLKQLETAILDNPSVGNYEELGELYSEEKSYVRARECFDKAITARTNMPSPFYGRALCELQLGDYPAARADLDSTAVIFQMKAPINASAPMDPTSAWPIWIQVLIRLVMGVMSGSPARKSNL